MVEKLAPLSPRPAARLLTLCLGIAWGLVLMPIPILWVWVGA